MHPSLIRSSKLTFIRVPKISQDASFQKGIENVPIQLIVSSFGSGVEKLKKVDHPMRPSTTFLYSKLHFIEWLSRVSQSSGHFFREFGQLLRLRGLVNCERVAVRIHHFGVFLEQRSLVRMKTYSNPRIIEFLFYRSRQYYEYKILHKTEVTRFLN